MPPKVHPDANLSKQDVCLYFLSELYFYWHVLFEKSRVRVEKVALAV